MALIGLGIDSVVMIARVAGIDRNQRDMSQVFPASELGWFGCGRFRFCGGSKTGRYPVCMDRDQAGGHGIVFVPQHLQQLATLWAVAFRPDDGRDRQVSIL